MLTRVINIKCGWAIGANLDIRMASLDKDMLLSVLFGNFELVGDILNTSD